MSVDSKKDKDVIQIRELMSFMEQRVNHPAHYVSIFHYR